MRSNNDVPDTSPPDAAPFNPHVALQSLLSADVVGVKQRVKAAQQLDEYFRGLTPTPGLLLSYEPYLPMLTEVMITPVKGGQELQTSVSTMLQTLSSHNPTGFSDWIARNTQMGNEPWLVQWSYALLLQVEKTVPRENEEWNETSVEFKDIDRVFARVLQMWRTLLDHTAEVALVDQLVKYLQALLMQTDATQQWHTLMLKKLQTHFVDIADVLIGWMMSTGPYSPLRQEILTLLHHFGRLWADNSVFSLQLLNSFADEIVNLCDSWKDHVEGDDDRLSTLLACFMMVAQCVPDLALPADESTESPFEKVLRRVASCSQPEYSLFCVANCSDYLVSMSNTRHRSFAPLSVTAVRFLLYHCAVQSRSHDSEMNKLSVVMENACKLASVLEDDIPSRIVKKGGQPKRVKVMECLFHMKCANAVTHSTQLCLQLTRLGGISALKVLGTRALQRLNGRNGDKGNSYFVFVATCFILVSRDPENLKFVRDDAMHTIEIFELITAKLEKQNYRHHKLTPRQLCLVLKMACAFIGTVSRWIVDRIDVVETMNGVSLRMLECAVSMLPGEAVVVPDYRLSIETLKVIDGVLSQTALVQVIPPEVCRRLLKKVTHIARCVSVKAREESIKVLETLYSRAEVREIAGDVFEVLLDLLLDPSRTVQTRIMPDALSGVSSFALLSQNKRHTPRHVSQALHPSFVGADFEIIMSHFQSRACDKSEWNRVCRSIASRTMSDVTLSNSGILLMAIRQAATWCVQNRLRTHFGGPAQSFASIERLLQEYSDEAQYTTGWTSQNNEALGRSYKPSYWISNWLMLEFVGELELRISRAICTTDVDQSNPESDEYKTVLFYRTNKAVCDDWLNRIRPFLVEMSKHGSSYELYRYHSHAMMTTCYSKLSRAMVSFTSRGASEKISNELRQAEKDLDSALYSLCKCHCDAKDSDSVIGFQRWGESISSALSRWYQLNKGNMDIAEEQCKMPLFRWLSAVRYEAAMRYADAATEYESLLEPVLKQSNDAFISAVKIFESPMRYLHISPPALLGCVKQCAKCYVALRDWTKLRQFVTHFVEVAKFLVDYDHPIEGIQAILGCSDKWSNEIGNICSLETDMNVPTNDTASESELNGDITKRTTLALRVWDTINQTDSGGPSAASFPDNVGDLLRDNLIPLALQSSPWNGYAGEKVGKKAEETLLRMFGLSKKYQLSTGNHQTEALVKVLRMNPEIYDSATWGQLYTPSLNGQSGSADANCLYLTGVARLARRQHNFGFAQELLREAAAIEGTNRATSMTITYEKSKLLETIGMEDEGRRLVVAQCETSLESIISNDKCSGQESVIVRSLLHLAKSFTKSDSAELALSATSRFLDGPLATVTSKVRDTLNYLSDVTLSDESAYRCLQAAITVSPESAKGWVQYSHWCYDRGKREIERITEQNGYIHLDPADESEMNSLLDEIGIAELDRDDVVRAFCHFLDNDELVSQRLDEFHQLCTDQAPPDHNSDTVERLIQLQQTCRSKVLRFHALSARGYGKYLKALLSGSDSSISRQEIIMVALRLLGLLTAYGTEKDVVSELEDVFSNGPVVPWSYVVPQLIARACHPVVAVSSLVCLILKRLAHHSPHAIVYPAVVDSMEPQPTLSILQERGTTTNTFAAVLQELHNVSSGQVEGVHLLISELRRISVLWDEAWISSLVKLSADVSRRSSTLEKEATRVEKNASLSAKEKSELAQRKLVAIMKPIYVSIERLWKETCGSVGDQHAVSPHERKFLKDYGGLIEKAMENFRDCFNSEPRVNPPPRMKNPQELWQPFEDMLKSLVNAASRRELLPLHDISPAMASMSRQLAMTNMPGIFSGSTVGQMKPITIHRVDSSVAVLRTKTKPKSMILIGSDGETYKYLLKAREDLRLDERIMQFLRVTNEFLRADDAAAARDLSAQSYSVIPISRNAGLIQMVPDVVPLFQVYTARNDSSGRAVQDPVATAQQQPPPPTAQFYAKLKQHGIANVAPNHRSQWPVSVLKQVYQELVAQRPRNVLQHELLRSEDIRESWTKSLRLSKSLAVMSVLGYIVGLGDRHLDNILLCVNSGDVVHIDHNVCFDKGRRLKVPEIVPFRLTPMLQDALGFTGVEGSFRVAFETTLRVVRSDDVREALLTLLETFVYCPLVDWITEDKRQERSGDLKARLEVNVNLSLFLSRAEERRQDTISFGRQYEQYADAISRVVKGAEIPFMTLLEQRKHLLSLECEEQALLKKVSCVEAELSEHQSAEQIRRTEAETATALAEDITTKMTSFASECLARHRQIELWRQKSINFAEDDPQTQLGAVTKATESASFLKIHATLCSVLEQTQFASRQQSELLAALEKKCRGVDEDVVRLRYEIERLATDLIPYLSCYGHQRKELDAYLDIEVKLAGKDVYFKWWNICTEYLRGLAGDQNTGSTDTILTCSAPSEDSVAESTVLLRRIGELNPNPNTQSNEVEETSCLSQADKLLQDIWNALSVMKLSNAQGQRLLKLAGASWIIGVMERLNEDGWASNVDTEKPSIFTPTLVVPSKFGIMASVSYACSTLLDLVSTPKGSMTRLRARELLASVSGRGQREAIGMGLNGFNDILQAVGWLAIVLQEEFLSNLHGRQLMESVESLGHIMEVLAAPNGMQDLMNTVFMSPTDSSNGVTSSVQKLLADYPAVYNVFAAAFDVVQKVSTLADMLDGAAVSANGDIEHIKSSSNTSWIDFVLNFIALFTVPVVDQGDHTKEAARTLWSTQIDGFVSNCLVKLLRYQLSMIIFSEWELDVFTPSRDQVGKVEAIPLSKRWATFFSSKIPDILPSTLTNHPDGTSETHATDVSKSIAELMAVCETWWSHQWNAAQWNQRVSSLRIRHERRLRYATWLATKPAEGETTTVSRIQLLAFLSSQVPHLNALLTDQVAVEASVLELAQQMDYLASGFDDGCADPHSANENLHTLIQSCYGNVVGLFGYGRTLADLVQGISVIETSSGESMPETVNMELEVDVAGKTLLQTASKATLQIQTSKAVLNEMTAHAHALRNELKGKQGTYDALAKRKRAAEKEFHTLGLEKKDAVLEIARVLSKNVKEMRSLFKHFDKLKTPSKQIQAPPAIMGSEGLRRQGQVQTEQPSSPSPERHASNSAATFSFMENDRLVKILLRSIRSVNHLQLLEGVLEKHGELCASLRGAVAQLDQVLRDFDVQVDQLIGSGQGDPVDTGMNAQESYLLLQLLLDLIEALHVTKNEPQPVAPSVSTTDMSEDSPISLLVVGRDLVRGCVKLFFEATDMADRLSSTQEESRRASGGASLPDEDVENEEVGVAEDSAIPLALESGNSAVMGVSSDSGSSSHAVAASTPRSVEEKSQYGIQVLKRIEEKLSGTVTEMADAPPVLTVEQQASWLIDEATKTDNLCVMYEGWTPWI